MAQRRGEGGRTLFAREMRERTRKAFAHFAFFAGKILLCGSASLRFLLTSALLAVSCSIPNLEMPECDQARDTVREFYSFHFGHDLKFSEEALNERRAYLTREFFDSVGDAHVDPFTLREDPPKAFRAGECKVLEPGKRTSFEVLLFWKDDVSSVQRSLAVELVNLEGKWLIDSVSHAGKAP